MLRKNNRPFLILPIETKVREFHAKLLLSCFAAIDGYNVILGDQNEIQRYLQYLPRGIYIDKSIASTKTTGFRRNKRLGNRVAAWCEEGLAFRDRETYLKERISQESFDLVDLFFTWGDVQAGAVKEKVPNDHNKIISTGNPRFDLLRYPYRSIFFREAEDICSRYGRFILINTNFSRYNHFYGRDFVIQTLKKRGKIRNKEEEAFFVKWADFLGEMYSQFLIMIKKISEHFPELTVIIRPHPSENAEKWVADTRNLENVKVIHQGSVVPWIIASEVMIHNSCTTGVEAFVLDEPGISYCPITSDVYDAELPNMLGRKVFDESELIHVIEALTKKESGPSVYNGDRDEQCSKLSAYLEGVQNSTACHNILTALNVLKEQEQQYRQYSIFSCFSFAGMKMNDLMNWARPFVRRIVKGRTGVDDYVKRKFPGLDLEEVESTIEIFQKKTNEFSSVKVKQVNGTKSCFCIYNNKEKSDGI